MVPLKPPYQYVIDTSALIDLKNQYPPKIFPGLWDRFNEMCDQKSIISTREVLQELKKGDDDLVTWAAGHDDIFLFPCEKEIEILQDVFSCYSDSEKAKHSTGFWADPLVIACAKHFALPIIQQESNDKNQYKIPPIAKIHRIECFRLIRFFENENWQF
jgi:hypothetical protein